MKTQLLRMELLQLHLRYMQLFF